MKEGAGRFFPYSDGVKMQKNEQLELTITDLSEEGLGIGKRDGFVWLVKGALIGDRILAQALKLKKHYGFARLIELLTPSPDRVEAPCRIAGQCGGCQLQSLKYSAQLKFKTRKLFTDLCRIGGVEEAFLREISDPIVGMENPLRYRNKAQYPIARDRMGRPAAGFYAGRSHRLIPCEDCLIGAEENRDILSILLRWMERFDIPPYDEGSGKGLIRHALIRKGYYSGEWMLCLVINGRSLPHWESLLSELKEAETPDPEDPEGEGFGAEFPSAGKEEGRENGGKRARSKIRLRSFSFSIHTGRDNVIMGREIVNLYGPGFIEDRIQGIRFRISPLSFYQVNPVQTERIYETVLEFSALSGTEIVFDLYCGIGTISLLLSAAARRVYGIEIIPDAVRDARENAERNGIENAYFFTGAAEELLPRWHAEHPGERIDLVCVDPPRKGCDERCLETIISMSPERLIYVSCDPATLARDIKYLREHGYELKRVRPFDNFPETVHVETVCLLSKFSGAKSHISGKVEMDEMDLTAAESKATYAEIRNWVQENYGFRVTNLNIAQVKRKHGIIERENHNKPKSEDSRHPRCPEEKEKAIEEALKHFQMIE